MALAAATLTSTFLHLTLTPHSKLRRSIKSSISPFKPKETSDDNEVADKSKFSPFTFKFGKLPNVNSLVPVLSNPSGLSFANPRRKDPATVFVAGGTGQAGIRIVQSLLREGFSVRAGVPDLDEAQELARLSAQYKIISIDESKRFNAVESSFQNPESIARAIGNASKVVVTIGPAENGPLSKVSAADASQVIQAAELAEVGHVAVVYDGSPTASTYNVLDGISSFFNNFFSQSQMVTVTELLQQLCQTNIGYTFIKTNLTDDFSSENSYNVVVSAEGTTGENDYKVSKSQIASLVAAVFSNTAIAENKVVEVSTDPSAPFRSLRELFSAIPEDGRRKAYAEGIAKAEAEEAAEKASKAAIKAKKLEDGVNKLSKEEAKAASLAEEAQQKAEAAGTSVESLLNKARDISSGFSWEKVSSQLATVVEKNTEKPKVQIATVRGQAKARSLLPNKAVAVKSNKKQKFSAVKAEKPKPKPTDSKLEVRKMFGGLFQQETLYIDDD